MHRKLLVAGIAVVVVGVATKVVAFGIPTTAPLVYSAILQDSNGQPLTGTQTLSLGLFPAASGGTVACVTTSTQVPDSTGRVRIPLAAQCLAAVKATPDLWAELVVGPVTLPRQKLNAVPYAVEADRAVRSVRSFAGTSISLNGLYCGATAVTAGNVTAAFDGGLVDGYRATKVLCEAACSSPTAHFCSTTEIMQSSAIGMSPVNGGFVASGVVASDGTNLYTDCLGFRNATATYVTPVWSEADRRVSGVACNSMRNILCCD